MESALGLFALLVFAGLGRLGLAEYRQWKVRRNELPDDERAQLYWNDQRYERLENGITLFWWCLFGLLAIVVVAAFAMIALSQRGG